MWKMSLNVFANATFFLSLPISSSFFSSYINSHTHFLSPGIFFIYLQCSSQCCKKIKYVNKKKRSKKKAYYIFLSFSISHVCTFTGLLNMELNIWDDTIFIFPSHINRLQHLFCYFIYELRFRVYSKKNWLFSHYICLWLLVIQKHKSLLWCQMKKKKCVTLQRSHCGMSCAFYKV